VYKPRKAAKGTGKSLGYGQGDSVGDSHEIFRGYAMDIHGWKSARHNNPNKNTGIRGHLYNVPPCKRYEIYNQ